MRFQNKAYMTNGFSERIPAAQKLMILDGINNARLFPECDYLQVFKLMPTNHEGRRAQKIVHTQEQPPYEKEYMCQAMRKRLYSFLIMLTIQNTKI